jgi:hypothetical protein
MVSTRLYSHASAHGVDLAVRCSSGNMAYEFLFELRTEAQARSTIMERDDSAPFRRQWRPSSFLEIDHLSRIVILFRLNIVSTQEGTPSHERDYPKFCADGTLYMG